MQTAEEILAILDAGAESYDFPMLDNGYIYPADVRMTLFRDSARWAIVIEDLGFFNHPSAAEDAFCDAVHYYGNCLKRKSPDGFASKEDFDACLRAHPYDVKEHLYPVSEGPSGPFLDGDGWFVRSQATDVRIRGHVVPIPKTPAEYAACGVTLEDPSRVEPQELLRALAFQHRDLLLATDQELRATLDPSGLPRILQLREWRHPDLVEEKPSQISTFQMLAEVLVTGDVARYRPKDLPNTHWSHWPEGGTL